MNNKQIIVKAWEDFKIIRNKVLILSFEDLQKNLDKNEYCVSPIFKNECDERYFKVTVDGLYLNIIEDEEGNCVISQEIYLEVDEEVILNGVTEEEFERLTM